MKIRNFALLLSIVFLSSSCMKKEFLESKIFAGGITASASDLNKGKKIYTEYCLACHGVNGDGKGPAHKGLQAPPRDFTQGIYKFGRVITGELPNDEDFFKLLKEGLHGSAMLPWDLSDKQMFQVVSYIKTFALKTWEGKDKKLGEPQYKNISKDPFGLAHRSKAVERGEKVFHAVAQCQSCHRAYVSFDRLSEFEKEINDYEPTADDFDPSIYWVKPQPSDYGFNTMPPDFTWHYVRSAKTVEEIYVRLLSGVGGTAMASWKDTLPDEDIWAVSHYVHHLMQLKNTPERMKMVKEIDEANKKYYNQTAAN